MMTMVRKVFHIEDSEVSRRYLKDLLRGVAPSVEIVPLASAMQAAEALERLPDGELPELILADHGLPRLDGTQFVSWVKMHPRLKSIPVIMVSAETDEQRKGKLKSLGVVQCLDKPLQADQLALALEAAGGLRGVPGISREAAHLFTDEAVDRIGRCEELLRLTKESAPRDRSNEIKRELHTLKGTAFTYLQPVLGEFVHDLEKFLLKADGGPEGISEEAGRILLDSLEFARELVWAIREQRPANLQRMDLMRAMSRYGIGEPMPPKASPVKRTPESTRIPDHKLNQLQEQFQRVLRSKNRLGNYARMLSTEFPEEAFPAELRKIHEELSSASAELMEFFLEMRSLPLSRIRDLLVRILMEAAEKLQREVDFEVDLDEQETVDSALLGCIEAVLVHTVRNAMDHGFDGRKDGNRLWISARRIESGELELRIRDNGRGVDVEALKRKVLETGVVDGKALSAIPGERMLELVFIDGISTRDEANEFSGRGIGLGAVKSEVERVGGAISVQSTAGEGTEFVIRMPRVVQR